MVCMGGFRVQGSGFRKAAQRFVELAFEGFFKAIEHAHAFFVPVAKGLERLLCDISLSQSNVNVMQRLEGLTTSSINPFDFILDVLIAVLLGQVCRRTVRGSSCLRCQFISLFRWPHVRQIAYLKAEVAQPLINNQVFDAKKPAIRILPYTSKVTETFVAPKDFL